jgi:serine/threonine-protein kinase haspin
MDHPVHGVKATVIDLGLARMGACGNDGSMEIRWTPFEEEIFEGEG